MCFGGDEGEKQAKEAEDRSRREAGTKKFETQRGINEVNRVFGNLIQGSDRPAIKLGQREENILSGKATPGDLVGEDALVGVDDVFRNILAGPTSQAGLESLASERREVLREGGRRGTFSFDDSPLLASLEKAFLDFATPEINRQAERAGEKTTQQLARRGTLKSSIAGERFADIDRQKAEALSRAATKASELRSQRISDLERSRTGIISQLEATGNTSSAAQSAINAVQAASATDNFQPLGEIFNVGLGTGADVLKSASRTDAPPTLFSSRGKGSSKVV